MNQEGAEKTNFILGTFFYKFVILEPRCKWQWRHGFVEMYNILYFHVINVMGFKERRLLHNEAHVSYNEKQNTTLLQQYLNPIKTNDRKRQKRFPQHTYIWLLTFLAW